MRFKPIPLMLPTAELVAVVLVIQQMLWSI